MAAMSLMKRQSARLMRAAMSVTAQRSFGGVVGDEVELGGFFEAGVAGVFGNELGALHGFFGGLEHRCDHQLKRHDQYCI